MNECQLGKEPFPDICCCTCYWHRPTYESCTANPLLRKEIARKIKESGGDGRVCICDIQNGWACVDPEMKEIHINWPEHSCGCELHVTEEQWKERLGMNKERLTVNLTTKDKKVFNIGDSAPVYLDEESNDLIGIAEIVDDERGAQLIITLDMETPGAQKAMDIMSGGIDISMSCHAPIEGLKTRKRHTPETQKGSRNE